MSVFDLAIIMLFVGGVALFFGIFGGIAEMVAKKSKRRRGGNE